MKPPPFTVNTFATQAMPQHHPNNQPTKHRKAKTENKRQDTKICKTNLHIPIQNKSYPPSRIPQSDLRSPPQSRHSPLPVPLPAPFPLPWLSAFVPAPFPTLDITNTPHNPAKQSHRDQPQTRPSS